LSSSSSSTFPRASIAWRGRFGDEERRLMHLVPAPAVKLMKGRVLSRPGMKKCLGLSMSFPPLWLDGSLGRPKASPSNNEHYEKLDEACAGTENLRRALIINCGFT